MLKRMNYDYKFNAEDFKKYIKNPETINKEDQTKLDIARLYLPLLITSFGDNDEKMLKQLWNKNYKPHKADLIETLKFVDEVFEATKKFRGKINAPTPKPSATFKDLPAPKPSPDIQGFRMSTLR